MKLRAAIVGTGDQGEQHAKAYNAVAGVELVAVCDIDKAKAETFAGRHGLCRDAAYESVNDLGLANDIDIWSVCTPPNAHGLNVADVMACPHAPVGVLVEKPPCLTWAELVTMKACTDRRGTVLTFGLHLRYTAFEWLRKVVAIGTLGDIYEIDTRWERREGTPNRGVFTRRSASGGGPGMDLLPHIMDMALMLMGPSARLKRVTAHTNSLIAQLGGVRRRFDPAYVEVEDHIAGVVALTVPWSSEAAHIRFSAAWELHGEERLSLDVYGTAGGARLTLVRRDGRERLVPTLYRVEEGQHINITVGSPDDFLPVDQCYAAEVADLVRVANTRRDGKKSVLQTRVTPDEAGRMLRVILGAYESAASSGDWVGLSGGETNDPDRKELDAADNNTSDSDGTGADLAGATAV